MNNNIPGVMKYRKKPVIIEARQFTEDSYWEIREWLGNDLVAVHMEGNKPLSLLIATLEGHITASLNDYIIKGVQGEFYPCKPDIFEQTYDLVEE